MVSIKYPKLAVYTLFLILPLLNYISFHHQLSAVLILLHTARNTIWADRTRTQGFLRKQSLELLRSKFSITLVVAGFTGGFAILFGLVPS